MRSERAFRARGLGLGLSLGLGRRDGLGLVLAFGLGLAGASRATADEPERRMNVTQGPETVFDRPVAEILPELNDARATGVNGRVGNELVFWGYTLADGRPANLYACAIVADVDCTARRALICAAATTRLIAEAEYAGNVARRRCQDIAVAAPGDRRPGCSDRSESSTLAVGLVSCG